MHLYHGDLVQIQDFTFPFIWTEENFISNWHGTDQLCCPNNFIKLPVLRSEACIYTMVTWCRSKECVSSSSDLFSKFTFPFIWMSGNFISNWHGTEQQCCPNNKKNSPFWDLKDAFIPWWPGADPRSASSHPRTCSRSHLHCRTLMQVCVCLSLYFSYLLLILCDF